MDSFAVLALQTVFLHTLAHDDTGVTRKCGAEGLPDSLLTRFILITINGKRRD